MTQGGLYGPITEAHGISGGLNTQLSESPTKPGRFRCFYSLVMLALVLGLALSSYAAISSAR